MKKQKEEEKQRQRELAKLEKQKKLEEQKKQKVQAGLEGLVSVNLTLNYCGAVTIACLNLSGIYSLF